ALGGALSISLLNGFMPQSGDIFDILSAPSGISGTFATTILPMLADDLTWNVVYDPDLVELQVVAPTLAGDFNGDGSVDAADYVVWRKGLGTLFMAEDYDSWQTNFGQSLGNGTSAHESSLKIAVPEPFAATLLGIGSLSLCVARRRFFRSAL
ncbi:MAG TPA: hypothetical protein VFW73_08855, partial [Lacipirellulaceae bacterium]|nr:hypothetical protein [Lacipirellulaceae bacterium]